MRTKIASISILLTLAIFSCEKHDEISMVMIDGFSLYWDHEVFGEEGRRLRFQVTTTDEYDNDYELVFDTDIDNKSITARLVKNIDEGRCQYYPMPLIGNHDPNKCSASGGFYLADKELVNGIYSFKIVAPSFEVTSELTLAGEQVTLEVPANNHLTSSIKYVYPIPKKLLFGSIFYQGSDNANDAEEFFNELTNLGLAETTVPNYPYRYLSVDENGQPPDSHWEPDYHSIGFLYKMNDIDFKTIFEASKKYFDQTNLDIYLSTSNGDEGMMSKTGGVTVVYGPQ